MDICEICGKKEATDTHHLIFGFSLREICDEDGITARVCRDCHREIHDGGAAGNLSKMLGQMMWEKEFGDRDKFRKRYGKSWL